MMRIQIKDASHDPQAVWLRAAREPVTIEEGDKAVAIVLSPETYRRLVMHPASGKRRFGRVTTDSNELFGLSDDAFCNYG